MNAGLDKYGEESKTLKTLVEELDGRCEEIFEELVEMQSLVQELEAESETLLQKIKILLNTLISLRMYWYVPIIVET